MKHTKIAAIVLAAGQGKRMESDIPKQYLLLQDKPILYYSLKQFECSEVDEIILVTGKGEIPYCRENVIQRFGFTKIKDIVEGGQERYHSVYEGLKAITSCDYVLIHDGARPFVNQTIIRDAIQGAIQYEACVVGMPVKDTIKMMDSEGFVEQTPDRSLVWMVQTPQAFSFPIIKKAYDLLLQQRNPNVTDDAMVVEKMLDKKVKLIKGSYENIKITTPSDLSVAESFLNKEERLEKE